MAGCAEPGRSECGPLLSPAKEQDEADRDDEDGADAEFMGLEIASLVGYQIFHLPRPLQELDSELVQHGKCDSDETLEVTCL